MKYSERLFEILNVVYSISDLQKSDRNAEYKSNLGIEVDIEEEFPQHALTIVKLPLEEIVFWGETFLKGTKAEEVIPGKSEVIFIQTKTWGDFLVWEKLKDFEKRYEEHKEKLDKYYDEKDEKELNSQLDKLKEGLTKRGFQISNENIALD